MLGNVAIGKPERQMRKDSHCGRKQQQRSHVMLTLLLLARGIIYMVVIHAHPVRGESHIQRNANREVATRTAEPDPEPVAPQMGALSGAGSGAQIKNLAEPEFSLKFRTGAGAMAI